MGKLLKPLLILFLVTTTSAQDCDSLHTAYLKARPASIEEFKTWVNKLQVCADVTKIQNDIRYCYRQLIQSYKNQGNIEEIVRILNVYPDQKTKNDIEDNYGTLRIFFDTTFSQMGKIKNIKEIKIETALPLGEELQQKRIEFLSGSRLTQEFRLNRFDSQQPEKGFFFELKYIPYLEYFFTQPDGSNFLIITIDNTYRYHVKFTYDESDNGIVEYKIPWRNEWEYIPEIDPNYFTVTLPARYRYSFDPKLNYFRVPDDEDNFTYYVDISENTEKKLNIIVEKSRKQILLINMLRYSSILVYLMIITSLIL